MRQLLFGVLGCSLVLSIQALYSSTDDVVELTPSNFRSEVIQSDSLWLVEFYAPWCGHCKSLAPEWKKVATALKGLVKVGAVDADKHNSLGSEYAVRGFPTIKIFGANKNKPEEYQGGRKAQEIIDQTTNTIKAFIRDRQSGKSSGSKSSNNQQGGGGGGSTGSGDKKDVVELTDDNFDKMVLASDDIWMVEFFAPWCGHCKSLEPEWRAAATAIKEQTKGKVHLGAVDATAHRNVAGRYKVNGYPTIQIFRKGEEPQTYEGSRSRGDIITKALELFSDNAPPPEVLEIINDEIFQKTCGDSQLCIVAVLPHILDTGASGRNGYLDIMKQTAEKYKKKMWGWLWAEAGTQMELEHSLEMGGFGYPAMAAINSRKKVYALLKGSFSLNGIHEFLREVSFGRGSTYKWGKGNDLPKIADVDSWDGQDGQLPEEDDVDLSDVDMSDDDYGSRIEL